MMIIFSLHFAHCTRPDKGNILFFGDFLMSLLSTEQPQTYVYRSMPHMHFQIRLILPEVYI